MKIKLAVIVMLLLAGLASSAHAANRFDSFHTLAVTKANAETDKKRKTILNNLVKLSAKSDGLLGDCKALVKCEKEALKLKPPDSSLVMSLLDVETGLIADIKTVLTLITTDADGLQESGAKDSIEALVAVIHKKLTDALNNSDQIKRDTGLVPVATQMVTAQTKLTSAHKPPAGLLVSFDFTGGGKFKGTRVDYAEFTVPASQPGATFFSLDALQPVGSPDRAELQLFANSAAGATTFPMTLNYSVQGPFYIYKKDGGQLTYMPQSDVAVIVIKYDAVAKTMMGTFSGTYKETTSGETISITNGMFSVKLTK